MLNEEKKKEKKYNNKEENACDDMCVCRLRWDFASCLWSIKDNKVKEQRG